MIWEVPAYVTREKNNISLEDQVMTFQLRMHCSNLQICIFETTLKYVNLKMCFMSIRAVKLAEKLKIFYQNIIKIRIIFKGINSVTKKKLLASLLRSQEGASSKILPNARFFKVGLGNMSKNSFHFFFLWFAVYVHISVFCVWSKQIIQVNVTM